MIYLVGSNNRAHRWLTDQGMRPKVKANPGVRVISDESQAHGHRPAPDDQIVLLAHGDYEAYQYLKRAQEFGAPGG